jgi:hypothetical protein
MELILVVMVFLALSYYMVGPCNCTGLCSPATYGNNLHSSALDVHDPFVFTNYNFVISDSFPPLVQNISLMFVYLMLC